MGDPGIWRPVLNRLPIWLLRGSRETFFGVLLAWLSAYTYDQYVKPLAAVPVHTGEQEEVRPDITRHIAPPLPAPALTPPPPPPPVSTEGLPLGPFTLSNGTQAKAYGHECRMPDGRSYTFRIVIFSAAYS